MKITVDGPAGSGKSFIAKGISRKLRIPYLETGLVYRAVGFVLLRSFKNVEDLTWEEVRDIVNSLEVIPLVERTEIFLGGRIVEEEALRSEEVGRAASFVGTLPQFREKVNNLFRNVVGEGQAVIEGRDAGTNIFPDADLKLFITASAEERARRRWRQLREKGIEESLESVLKKIEERDRRDMERENYPFRPAEDAVVVDTTDLSPEESLELVLDIVKRLENEKRP